MKSLDRYEDILRSALHGLERVSFCFVLICFTDWVVSNALSHNTTCVPLPHLHNTIESKHLPSHTDIQLYLVEQATK